jgi:hypothetical protein
MNTTIPSPPGLLKSELKGTGFQLLAAHTFPARSEIAWVRRINWKKEGGPFEPFNGVPLVIASPEKFSSWPE